jgi:hypothetical protein
LLHQLRAACIRDHTSWPLVANNTAIAYYNSRHSAHGFAPAEVIFGQSLSTPALPSIPINVPRESMIQLVRERLAAAASHMKYWSDKHQRESPIYNRGDCVWVSLRRFLPQGISKLSPRCDGPFCFLKRVNDLAYRVALPPPIGFTAITFFTPVFFVLQVKIFCKRISMKHLSRLNQHFPNPGHRIKV